MALLLLFVHSKQVWKQLKLDEVFLSCTWFVYCRLQRKGNEKLFSPNEFLPLTICLFFSHLFIFCFFGQIKHTTAKFGEAKEKTENRFRFFWLIRNNVLQLSHIHKSLLCFAQCKRKKNFLLSVLVEIFRRVLHSVDSVNVQIVSRTRKWRAKTNEKGMCSFIVWMATSGLWLKSPNIVQIVQVKAFNES